MDSIVTSAFWRLEINNVCYIVLHFVLFGFQTTLNIFVFDLKIVVHTLELHISQFTLKCRVYYCSLESEFQTCGNFICQACSVTIFL